MPRDPRATTYLMGFVVSTVLTILILRASLAMAGYPQVGGNGLHIAHALWGGLLLSVAIVLSMSFIGQVIRPYVAIVGGIGFGLFLDEVGKFVTSTNNYFFRPAIAIVYLTVVLFVLVIQWVHGRRPTTPAEYLAAALAEVCAAAGGGFSDQRRDRALLLIQLSDGEPGCVEAEALVRSMPRGRQLGDPLIAMRRWIQLSAYGWFERAVLVDLLLTQVFSVTSDQFSALPSIAIDLIMLAVLGAARSQYAFTQDQLSMSAVARRSDMAAAVAGP